MPGTPATLTTEQAAARRKAARRTVLLFAILAVAAGYWGVVRGGDLANSPNDAAVIAAMPLALTSAASACSSDMRSSPRKASSLVSRACSITRPSGASALPVSMILLVSPSPRRRA